MSEALALRDVLHACGDAGSQLYNFGNRVSERLDTWSSREQSYWANPGYLGTMLDQRFRERGDGPLTYSVVADLGDDPVWTVLARVKRDGRTVWKNSPVVAETTADVCQTFRNAVRAIEATVLGDDFLRAVFPGVELSPSQAETDRRFDGPKDPVAGVPLVGLRAVCDALEYANSRVKAAGAALAERYRVARPEHSQSAWEGGYEARHWAVYLDLKDADLLTHFELDYEPKTAWTARAGIGFEWPVRYSGGAMDNAFNWRHKRRHLTTFAAVADAARRTADELLAEAERIDLVPPGHLPR